MKKIGIFLAFAPEQPIRNQGIGRLTAFIIDAILKREELKITIAAPEWYKTSVLDFLTEHRIDIRKIELMTTNKLPLLLRIRHWLKGRDDQRNQQTPVAPARMLGYVKIRHLLFAPLAVFRRNLFVHHLYYAFRKRELGRLIKIINQHKEVDVWFVPALSWPEIEGIQAKKVVAAPDIVHVEFPLLFSTPFYKMVSKKISKTIQAANHFICYSEHVKQKHLIEGSSINAQKISVVKHGHIGLRSFLEADNMKRSAQQILNDYLKNLSNKDECLKDFNFTDVNYIFYSSQIRPHKNFMSLIKAYEILLRQRSINFKLITTANIKQEKEVWDYIVSRDLQRDILCFNEVSSEVLAALNHLAVCAVNPTLFEGGFPFTFTEAYSVGTPSVMSRIAVVLDEVGDQALQARMLFDPYNIDDMVTKIEWAMHNRSELFALEASLYQKMALRTWETVANEYIEVFKSVGEHKNEVFA